MYPVTDQFYGPIVREKGGELQAAAWLGEPMKSVMLPTWVALPLNAKENSGLNVTGVMKREVGRVLTAWGSNVCLWDPRFLRFNADHGDDGDCLRHILGQFASFGCRVVPVASLRESISRLSAMSAHSSASGSGLAVRIEFDELADFEVLDALLKSARIEASNCILLVDLTNADMSEHDEFAQFLVEALDGLAARGNWARIIVAGSSYPLTNPAAANNEASPERVEWKVWEWALRVNPELFRSVVYGDFGADNPYFKFEGGGIPIPHLRYALPSSWRVVRGGSKPVTIREVARRISSASSFMGREFSDGDEFIDDCAAGAPGGDATRWRAANMNHHFMVVLTALAALYGRVVQPRIARQGRQHNLFEDQEAK